MPTVLYIGGIAIVVYLSLELWNTLRPGSVPFLEYKYYSDIVSFTNGQSMACTSIVMTNSGPGFRNEVESSVDCETAPPGRTPAANNRRRLIADKETWTGEKMFTETDAHGRACTIIATSEETSIDCDYLPKGIKHGAAARQQAPDLNPKRLNRIWIATFNDSHGRACTTTIAKREAEGAIVSEIDLTCHYIKPKKPRPTETLMPR
jgi:hypothetical protein